MYCQFCGKEHADYVSFCPYCGMQVSKGESVEEQVAVDPIYQREKDELGGEVLKFGILGLAFACSGLLSLLGLIFSIIARAKAGAFARRYGDTEGRATVGKHLGKAGLIVSIVITAYFALIFVLAFLGMLTGAETLM